MKIEDYQELFDLMSSEHGLILTDDEMNQIINKVAKIVLKEYNKYIYICYHNAEYDESDIDDFLNTR